MTLNLYKENFEEDELSSVKYAAVDGVLHRYLNSLEFAMKAVHQIMENLVDVLPADSSITEVQDMVTDKIMALMFSSHIGLELEELVDKDFAENFTEANTVLITTAINNRNKLREAFTAANLSPEILARIMGHR